ncbi:hypothetical protein CEV33_4972 [Brucella grignonensis]|uniref:Uncharacterized protein n=1 Tax=Brucella grignonensis TaxID=94627 RepID=A0A256FS86_9HYPH|nr:hypothetical protein CEV33_4972 [Brucella grignonensis]
MISINGRPKTLAPYSSEWAQSPYEVACSKGSDRSGARKFSPTRGLDDKKRWRAIRAQVSQKIAARLVHLRDIDFDQRDSCHCTADIRVGQDLLVDRLAEGAPFRPNVDEGCLIRRCDLGQRAAEVVEVRDGQLRSLRMGGPAYGG